MTDSFLSFNCSKGSSILQNENCPQLEKHPKLLFEVMSAAMKKLGPEVGGPVRGQPQTKSQSRKRPLEQ